MNIDKKKLEIIITSVLILVFILAFANSFKSIRKRIKPKEAPQAQAQARPAALSQTAAVSQGPTPAKEEEKLVWGRDPFSGKVYSSTERAINLSLSGILWDSKNPQALINSEIVRVGDTLGNYTVIGITKDRVILNDGTKDFELILGR